MSIVSRRYPPRLFGDHEHHGRNAVHCGVTSFDLRGLDHLCDLAQHDGRSAEVFTTDAF